MNNASHVLPRDKGAAPLDFVIAVMAFLAALALGASLIADRAAQGWQSGLAAKMTVQILPPDSDDARAALDAQIRGGARHSQCHARYRPCRADFGHRYRGAGRALDRQE